MSNIQLYSSSPGSTEFLDSGSKHVLGVDSIFRVSITFVETKTTSLLFNKMHKSWWGGKWDCQTLYSPQFFSSLPSAQSSSPSHFHSIVIQRPFVHWNWEVSHLVFLPKIRKEHLTKPGIQGWFVRDASYPKPMDRGPLERSCRPSRLSPSRGQSRIGLGAEMTVTEALAGHTSSR